MKIKLSKSQWEMIGVKSGWTKTAQPALNLDQRWEQENKQPKLYNGYPTQEKNTEYVNRAVQQCSKHLNYWARNLPKMIQEVLKTNPQAQMNDIKRAILELNEMEEDMATAITNLLQKMISQGFENS